MDVVRLFQQLHQVRNGEGTQTERIEALGDAQRALLVLLRDEVTRAGGRGAVPHALNVAATHAQDAYGALRIAADGGSPGIV